MRCTNRTFILFLFFLFSFSAFIHAQPRTIQPKKPSGETKLNWQPNQVNTISEDISLEYLALEGANYNEYFFPLKAFNLPDGTPAGSTIRLNNVVTEQIASDQLKNIKYLDKLPADFSLQVFPQTARKKSSLAFSILPLRKTSSGIIEKLVSFEYTIVAGNAKTSAIASRSYAPYSVLSTGNWYKIGVTSEGIYKLSYGFLDSLGLDVKTINPRNLRIYGNGGEMLPFDNSKTRPDDLNENPIFVSGDADGRFDSTDYILFYGQSPHKWKYNYSEQRFRHFANIFTDTTFYFVTADGGLGAPKRIGTAGSTSASPTHFVNSFDDYQLHEQENINLVKSGRNWFGETFDLTLTYSIPFNFPNIDPSSQACVYTTYMARTTSNQSVFTINHPSGSNTFAVPVLNQNIYNCYYCDYTLPGDNTFCFTPGSSQFSLNMTFTKGNSGSSAYLDYMEVSARRYLKPSGNQLFFRDLKSKGVNNVAEFTISDANSTMTVWDVTDPYNILLQQANFSGSALSFRVHSDSLKQFALFSNSFPVPVRKGKIETQNLHGVSQYKYVIVSHPKFITQANRLANIHRTRSGLKTIVVPVNQIYNEFSSGAPDLTSIKDFMKMLYDRAGSNQDSLPSYLLLFGDASYSYKSVSGNTNYVPTYESENSTNPVASYVSDDYLGLLDDTEGEDVRDMMDIGIGRFPVQDLIQARGIVDKIDAYTRPMDALTLEQACSNASASNANYGDWRTNIAFTADDEDSNQHLKDAESLTDTVKANPNAAIYNLDKIYFDSFQQQTVPGGQRYPEARDALNHRVEKGALIINYTGHGGELGLSHERVLEIADINGWSNSPRLPLFVTATCEFSRFDDPARISAGEYILLNPSGGGISLLSTTRLVFSGPNWVLNLNFYQNVFEPEPNGEMPRIGDVCRHTKNAAASIGGVNHRNFSLLGDPAIRLAYPENRARTTLVNSKDPLVTIDTARALTKVTISGYVTDKNGSKLTGYNGLLIPTIYDKPATIRTLGNDPGSMPARNFVLQKNTIYKGKVSVTNGDFTFSFIVPKDISYNFGKGRVSYYFMNESGDGAAAFEDIVIGGSNPNGLNDNIGPEVKLFMNDKNFISGGMTNENPSLFATVFDSSGINTVGTGIGHDIVAVLDKNTEHSVVLNDYYEADLNSYQSGVIRYPYKNISEGIHTLSLKVWDINNNSNEKAIDFIVSPSAELALKHVLNYPNPFTTHTSFFFEHNQACLGMDVQIQIFTVSGKLIKTIDKRVKTEGYRTEPIDWDGRDDFGDKIGRGVYVYRIKVIASNGSTADHFEKLVILN